LEFQTSISLESALARALHCPNRIELKHGVFPQALQNLDKDDFFSPTSFCLMGNITPKPPPLLRIERAAPRTAASEFPPPNWGNVAVPKRVRAEEKMEKKRQVISSAHITN